MSWRPGRSRSFRRSEAAYGKDLANSSSPQANSTHNNTSSPVNSLSPNNHEETSSRTSFLRLRNSSSDNSSQPGSRGSSFRSSNSGSQTFSLGGSFRLNSRSSNSNNDSQNSSAERSASSRNSSFSESLKSSTLPWSFNRDSGRSGSSAQPNISTSLENSQTKPGLTITRSSDGPSTVNSREEQPYRLTARPPLCGDVASYNFLRPTEDKNRRFSQSPSVSCHEGSVSPRPPGSNPVSRNPSNASSVSSSVSMSSTPGTNRGSTRRRLQRVELLQLTEPFRELIHPSSVVVSQGEVYRAHTVQTPIEKLRRKDEEIVRALEEKQRLIEDIMRLQEDGYATNSGYSSIASFSPGGSFSTASSGYGSTGSGSLAPGAAGPSSSRGATEVLLNALTDAKQLASAINKCLRMSEEDVMRNLNSTDSGSGKCDMDDKEGILRRSEHLVDINNNINRLLTLLLVMMQDSDKERESLRKEVTRSQEQMRALMAGGPGPHPAGGGPPSTDTGNLTTTPMSPLSPFHSPFTSKSSSPPLSEAGGDRHTNIHLFNR